jgi:hypothetical protein
LLLPLLLSIRLLLLPVLLLLLLPFISLLLLLPIPLRLILLLLLPRVSAAAAGRFVCCILLIAQVQ